MTVRVRAAAFGIMLLVEDRGAGMGAERERVSEFGKLGNGLRQAGDWYGPLAGRADGPAFGPA